MRSVAALRSVLLIAFTIATVAAAKDPAPAPSRSRQVTGPADPNKSFHLGTRSSSPGMGSSFSAKTARSDGFYIQQKFQPKSFGTEAFATKSWNGKFQFSTHEAVMKGKYEIPNATKSPDTRTAPTKDARESGKTMAVRDLPDGNRPYLGKEATKMKTPLDPNNLPKITNDMRELKTIDDVKELLNKNR